jgi:hypothetical protein
MVAQLLDMQYRGQGMSYRAQFPNAESSIVWLGEERIGRLYVNESADELRVVDIALSAAYRGRGFGRKLLEDVGARARARGVPVRLSVRPDSAAARLYQRVGFVAVSATDTHIEMEWNVASAASQPDRTNLRESTVAEPGPAPHLEASSAGFRSLLGRQLRAEPSQGAGVLLRITAVRPLVSHQPRIVANDSFTVTFAGPPDAVLPPATYSLTYGDSPALPVFLSPLGSRAGEMEYEAVFNRMAVG